MMKKHVLSPWNAFLLLLLSSQFSNAGPPSLGPIVRTNGQARILVEGESKASYVVYSSTNLIEWNPCFTNESSLSSKRLLSFSAPEPFAYYRASRLPLPVFSFGIAARESIDFSGNNIVVDSFDSSDPSASTYGLYDLWKRRDHGDVATNLGLTNSLIVGNAEIWGKITTGPGGSVSIEPSVSIGNIAWHVTGRFGIMPGFFTNDMNVDFPEVEPPFDGGYLTPSTGTNNGVRYDYLLGDGQYQIPTLTMSGSQSLCVKGDAILYVTGDISLSGTSSIVISTGAVLRLYVGGANATIGGYGIINEAGKATNFVYFGLPSNTNINLAADHDCVGAIYAPNANLTLSGINMDFTGACTVKSLRMWGHVRLHYDEALGRSSYVR